MGIEMQVARLRSLTLLYVPSPGQTGRRLGVFTSYPYHQSPPSSPPAYTTVRVFVQQSMLIDTLVYS